MRQTLKDMGEARHVEESADTKPQEKHTGVFCDGLRCLKKARRSGVRQLRNRAQELVIWGLGGHRGSYQNDPPGVWAQQHVCHKGM